MKYTLIETPTFSRWLEKLRDRQSKAAITARLAVIALTGHLGDHRSVGDGVSELRIHSGAGYRVYYTQREEEIIILLAGGDKDSQKRDIPTAKQILQELEDE